MNHTTRRKIQLLVGIGIFVVAVTLSYFSIEEIKDPKYDIYLVLDISGSMVDQSKIQNAKQAASQFVDALELDKSPNYRIGLIAFETQVHVLTKVTSDPNNIKNIISGLNAGGGTAMGDAIGTATNLLSQESRPNAKKIILLLSDGQNTEGTDPISTARLAEQNGIIIFTIGYGFDADAFTLGQIASMSRGQYYQALTGKDLVSTFNNIANVLISPLAHYGSRTLILIAIPILLFLPAIEKGVATIVRKAEETFIDKRGPKQIICSNCGHANRLSSKFCGKCGTTLKGRK